MGQIEGTLQEEVKTIRFSRIIITSVHRSPNGKNGYKKCSTQ
jgi:hypothetical protein